MKRFLLYLSLLFPVLAQAQIIPNGNFEIWVHDTLNVFDPNAQIPAGWQGTSFGGTINKGSGGPAGSSFYANLKEGNFMGTLFPGAMVVQFPANSTSRYLNGYLRKPSGATDTVSVTVVYTRDGVGIGGGGGQTNALFPNWTPFSVEIIMQGGAQVDSAAISLLVQGSGPGYQFDNFTFSNTPNTLILGDLTGVKSNRRAGSLTASLAPNPVSGDKALLNVAHLSGTQVAVRIVDVLGNTVWSTRQSVSASDAAMAIGMSNLTKGLYRIVVENGDRRQVVSFIKQ